MPQPSSTPRRPSACGFTFVELMMGLIVTMLVTAALAAFTFAISNSWQQSEAGQSLYLGGNQAVSRVQRIVESTRQLGTIRAGSADGSATGACAVIWKTDTDGDGRIDFSEIGLIQHNTATHELVYYEANPPAGGDWLASTAFISASTAPETFKALSYVTSKKLAKNVLGAQFTVTSSGSHTQRPIFECVLTFSRNNQTSTVYGSTAMRSIDQASN